MQSEISTILLALQNCSQENDDLLRGFNIQKLLTLLPQEQLRAATTESTALRRIILRAVGGVPFLKRCFQRGYMNEEDKNAYALDGSFLLVSALLFDQELVTTDSELWTVAADVFLSLSTLSITEKIPLNVLSSGVSAAQTILHSNNKSLISSMKLSVVLSGLCLSARCFIRNTQYNNAQITALTCALYVLQTYTSWSVSESISRDVSIKKNEKGIINDKEALECVYNESLNVCNSLVSIYTNSRGNGDLTSELAGKVLAALLENVSEIEAGKSVNNYISLPQWCLPFRYILVNDISSQKDEGRIGDFFQSSTMHTRHTVYQTLSLRLLSLCSKAFGPTWLFSTLPQREDGEQSATSGDFTNIVSRLVGAVLKQTLDEFEICLILARGTGGFLVPDKSKVGNKDGNNGKQPLRGVAPLTREERTRRILPNYASLVDLLGASVNAYISLVQCLSKMSSKRILSKTEASSLMRLFESVREICSLLLSFLSDAWGSDLRPLLALPAIISSSFATTLGAQQLSQPLRVSSTDEADTLEEASLPWRLVAVQPVLTLCVSGVCIYLLEGGVEAFHSELLEALPCMMCERSTISTFSGVLTVSILSRIEAMHTEAARNNKQQRPNPFMALASLSDLLEPINTSIAWRLPLCDTFFTNNSNANEISNATIHNPKHLVIQVLGSRLASKDVLAAIFNQQNSSSLGIIPIAFDLLLSYCRYLSITFMHVESSVNGGLPLTRNLVLPALSSTFLIRAIDTCRALLDLARTLEGFKQLSSMNNLEQSHASFLITAQRLAGKRARSYAKDLFVNGLYVESLQLSLARHLTTMSALSLWPSLITAKKIKSSTLTSGIDVITVSDVLRDVAFELFNSVITFNEEMQEDDEDEIEKQTNLKLLDCIIEIVGTG
jgi:hypothetical protein